MNIKKLLLVFLFVGFCSFGSVLASGFVNGYLLGDPEYYLAMFSFVSLFVSAIILYTLFL